MDATGAHAEACMAGGDKTISHNVTRDNLYNQSKAAAWGPVLEAVRVLEGGGRVATARELRRRPADVLLCSAGQIRTGGGVSGSLARVALDVGIICPQAAVHRRNAAAESLGAAEQYAVEKCGRDATERRCREAGVSFQPMIFESLGGVSSEAERVIKALNKAVAERNNENSSLVARRFWQRLSIDLQRAGHSAWARRVGKPSVGGSDGLGWLLSCAVGLEPAAS